MSPRGRAAAGVEDGDVAATPTSPRASTLAALLIAAGGVTALVVRKRRTSLTR